MVEYTIDVNVAYVVGVVSNDGDVSRLTGSKTEARGSHVGTPTTATALSRDDREVELSVDKLVVSEVEVNDDVLVLTCLVGEHKVTAVNLLEVEVDVLVGSGSVELSFCVGSCALVVEGVSGHGVGDEGALTVTHGVPVMTLIV